MAINDSLVSPFPTMQPGEHLNPVQFSNEASDGTGVFGSAELADAQDALNARVPRSVVPSMSLNGMSDVQYQATLGGAFPTSNGMAANQYDVAKYSMREGF